MVSLSRKEMSKALQTLVHTELQPSAKFVKLGGLAVDWIFSALKTKGSKLSIDRCVIAGSIGKGTAIGDTDFDLVVFINGVDPPFSIGLIECMEGAIMGLPSYKRERINRFSLQFTLLMEGSRLKFDLLPASNLMSRARLEEICRNNANGQAERVRRRLKKFLQRYPGNCLSSSLAEQTVLFLKRRPKEIVSVVKLAKYWDKQIKGMGYIRGRSFLIELVAVYAQKGKYCALLQRFIHFLNLMKNFRNLEIIFGHHYKRSSIPENILYQRPLIMDPCNHTNNIAYGIAKSVQEKYMEMANATLEFIFSGEVEDVHDLFSPYDGCVEY